MLGLQTDSMWHDWGIGLTQSNKMKKNNEGEKIVMLFKTVTITKG